MLKLEVPHVMLKTFARISQFLAKDVHISYLYEKNAKVSKSVKGESVKGGIYFVKQLTDMVQNGMQYVV